MGALALRIDTNCGRNDEQMGWTSFGKRCGTPESQRLRGGSAAIRALSMCGRDRATDVETAQSTFAVPMAWRGRWPSSVWWLVTCVLFTCIAVVSMFEMGVGATNRRQ